MRRLLSAAAVTAAVTVPLVLATTADQGGTGGTRTESEISVNLEVPVSDVVAPLGLFWPA
jgi:hypothetical protein